MTVRVLPYRIPGEDTVQAGPWRIVTPDGEEPLPEALADWDYRTDLHLRRTVHVDQGRVRAQTGLPAGAPVVLSAVWTATGTNLGGSADRARLTGETLEAVELNVHLPGADLGGLLRLDTALLLAERRPDAPSSTPRRAGSVLWSDRTVLRLQGDAPQFPMAVVDFARTSFPDDATWHLQIVGGLDSATMGSLLLLVNERNELVTAAVANAARPRPVDRVVLSALQADVARTMVEYALSREDFDDLADFAESSLGSTLLSLFDRLFPGQSITDIRLRRDQSPNLFASEVQAATRMFEVTA
ncbi:hypothetical protein [Streptacidiphilus jiangxiensis]|uniref:Uncharacterized protein n=1 Tax=Streptacidiphilus jiangxiensis TaxID=235985 RepID=A0A1H7REQ5_STRJI|nr:hypothetical protein [Streptacidiphilus jiangxiensis]SEL58414.1 hypothetical protein SAMN05414137_11078 [Streptacidiphilus jiangxiensis]